MKTTARIRLTVLGGLTAGAIVVLPGAPLAQQAPPPQQTAPPAQAPPNPNQAAFAAAQAALQEAATADRKDMMEQLGIKALRPGPSGNEQAPNHANYDEAIANPYPESARRPHAEERQEGHDAGACGGSSGVRRSSRTSSAKCSAAFRRSVPKVTWTESRSVNATVGGRAVIGKQLIGHVDNSIVSGDHRRHPDDAGHAGRREGSGAGDDHVRRRPRAAGRSAAPGPRRRSRRPRLRTTAGERSAGDRAAHRRRLGLRVAQPRQHPGRQRRRADERHHRPREQGPAPQARRLGRAARLGVGRVARPRLSRDRQGGGREAGRHRRRLALRQGGAGHDGVRHALRGRAGRIVGRRRREAAPPQLGRSGREPHRLAASITGWPATS